MDVIGQYQPQDKTLHYSKEQAKSVRAEEEIFRQVLKDPELLPTVSLFPQQFSLPILGRAFALLKQAFEEGHPASLGDLNHDFSPTEMAYLASLVEKFQYTVSETVLRDCVRVVQKEFEKNQRQTDADALMAFRAQRQKEDIT